jgi:hypothetical protein
MATAKGEFVNLTQVPDMGRSDAFGCEGLSGEVFPHEKSL